MKTKMKRGIAGFLSFLILFTSVFTGNVTIAHAADGELESSTVFNVLVQSGYDSIESIEYSLDGEEWSNFGEPRVSEGENPQATYSIDSATLGDATYVFVKAALEDGKEIDSVRGLNVNNNGNRTTADDANAILGDSGYCVEFAVGDRVEVEFGIQNRSQGGAGEPGDGGTVFEVFVQSGYTSITSLEYSLNGTDWESFGEPRVGEGENPQATYSIDSATLGESVTYVIVRAVLEEGKEIDFGRGLNVWINGSSNRAEDANAIIGEAGYRVDFSDGNNVRVEFGVQNKGEVNPPGPSGEGKAFDIVCQEGFGYITAIEYYLNGDDENPVVVTSEEQAWEENWHYNCDSENDPPEWENYYYSIPLGEDDKSVAVRVIYNSDVAYLDEVRGIVLRADGREEGSANSFNDFVVFEFGEKSSPCMEFGFLSYPDRIFDFSVWNEEGLEHISALKYSLDGGRTYTTIGQDDFMQRFPDEWDPTSGEEPEWTNWVYHLYDSEGERTEAIQAFVDALNSAESIKIVVVPEEGYEIDVFEENRIEGWDNSGHNHQWGFTSDVIAALTDEAKGGYTFTFEEGYYFYDFGFAVRELRDRFEVNVWNGWQNHIEDIEYKINGAGDFISISDNVRVREFFDEEAQEMREETVYYIPCDDATSVTVRVRLLDGTYINDLDLRCENNSLERDAIIDALLSEEGFTYVFKNSNPVEREVNLGFNVEHKENDFYLFLNDDSYFNHVESVFVGYSEDSMRELVIDEDLIETWDYDFETNVAGDWHAQYGTDFPEGASELYIKIIPKEGYQISYADCSVGNGEYIWLDDYYRRCLSGQIEEENYYVIQEISSEKGPYYFNVDIRPISRYRLVDSNGNVLDQNTNSSYDIGNLISFSGTQKYYLQEIDAEASRESLTYKNITATNNDVNIAISRIGSEGDWQWNDIEEKDEWIINGYHYATDSFMYATNKYPELEGFEDDWEYSRDEKLTDYIFSTGMSLSGDDLLLRKEELTTNSAVTFGSDSKGCYVQINWAKAQVYEQGGCENGQAYISFKIWDESDSWTNDMGETECYEEYAGYHFVNTDFYLRYYNNDNGKVPLPNNTEVKVDPCSYYTLMNGVFDYQLWNGNPESVITNVRITNSTPSIATVLYTVEEGETLEYITLIPKNPGLATFTIHYEFNGKEYSYTAKVRVDLSSWSKPTLHYTTEGNLGGYILKNDVVHIPAGSKISLSIHGFAPYVSDATVTVSNKQILNVDGTIYSESIPYTNRWFNEIGDYTVVSYGSDLYLHHAEIYDIVPAVAGVAQGGTSTATVKFKYNGTNYTYNFKIIIDPPAGYNLREVEAEYNGEISTSPYSTQVINLNGFLVNKYALFFNNEKCANTSEITYSVIKGWDDYDAFEEPGYSQWREEETDLFEVVSLDKEENSVIALKVNYNAEDHYDDYCFYLIASVPGKSGALEEVCRIPIISNVGEAAFYDTSDSNIGLYYDSNYQFATKRISITKGQSVELYSYVPINMEGMENWIELCEEINYGLPSATIYQDDNLGVVIQIKEAIEDRVAGNLVGYKIRCSIDCYGDNSDDIVVWESRGFEYNDYGDYVAKPFILYLNVVGGENRVPEIDLRESDLFYNCETTTYDLDCVRVSDYEVALKTVEGEKVAYILGYVGNDNEVSTPGVIQIPVYYGENGQKNGNAIMVSIPVVGIAVGAFDETAGYSQPEKIELANSYLYYGFNSVEEPENAGTRLISDATDKVTSFSVYTPIGCNESRALYVSEQEGGCVLFVDTCGQGCTDPWHYVFFEDGNAPSLPIERWVEADTRFNWMLRELKSNYDVVSGDADELNGEENAIVFYRDCAYAMQPGEQYALITYDEECINEIKLFRFTTDWRYVSFDCNGGSIGYVGFDGINVETGEPIYNFYKHEVDDDYYQIPYLYNEYYGDMPFEYKEGLNNYPNIEAVYREGYSFDGWFTAATGGTKVTSSMKFMGTDDTVLYAHWTPNKYNIEFKSNAPAGLIVSGSMTNQTNVAYGVETTLKANGYKIPGYELVGWSLSGNEDDIICGDLGKVNNLTSQNNGRVTLYAIWQPITYRITYHLGGGEFVNPENVANVYDITTDADEVPAVEGIRDESGQIVYSFNGWYTDNTYKNPIETIGGGMIGDIDMWAKFVPATFNVTFNPNYPAEATGVSGSMAPQSYQYGIEQALRANTFKAPGYVFVGWSLDKTEMNDSPIEETPNYYADKAVAIFESAGNVTLYGVWKQVFAIELDSLNTNVDISVPEDYPIEFDMSHLKFGFVSATYTYGTECVLPPASMPGYTFNGWYTEQHLTGTKPVKVTKITRLTSGEVCLAATWIPWNYSVVFDGNGKTGGTMSTLKLSDYGSSVIMTELPVNKFTRLGYHFVGWSTNPNCAPNDAINPESGIIVNYGNVTLGDSAIGTCTKNNDTIKLYAVWEEDTPYTVTIHMNGLGTNVDDLYESNGAVLGITKDSEDATGNTYTFNYTYANTKGAAITLPYISSAIEIDEAGHPWKFVGYYTDAACTKKVTTITKGSTGNIDLYVKWQYDFKYTIAFDASGNLPEDVTTTGSMINKTATYGTAFTLPANTYKATGWLFVGWSEEELEEYADKDSAVALVEYADKAKITMPSIDNVNVVDGGCSVILHAVWVKAGTVTLMTGSNVYLSETYDMEYTSNSDGTSYEATYEFGSMQELPIPERGGYEFVGWYSDKSLRSPYGTNSENNTNIVGGDYYNRGLIGNITLYPKWKARSYVVVYHSNAPEGCEVSGMMAEQNMVFGTGKTLTANKYVVDGYTFMGWNHMLESDGNYYGWYVNSEKIVTPPWCYLDYNEELERYEFNLYAEWADHNYVSFEMNDADSISFDVSNLINPEEEHYGLNNEYTKITASYNFGTEYKLPVAIRTGYTFAGWINVETNKKITSIPKTMRNYIVLRPSWTPNKYTIVFNPNLPEGVTANPGRMANQAMVYGTGKAIATNAFKLAGYTFEGWATSPDGEVVYSNKQVFNGGDTYSSQITLFAVWSKNTYTITANNLVGVTGEGIDEGVFTTTYVVTDNVADILPDPARLGYTFMGWFTDAKCSKKFVAKDGMTGNITLYAKWVVNKS